MKLENLLPEHEVAELLALVVQAAKTPGSQAVRWHSMTHGVVIVGICAHGQLLTWFASPAATAIEAATCQAVILTGLQSAAADVQSRADVADVMACDAIAKAATKH